MTSTPKNIPPTLHKTSNFGGITRQWQQTTDMAHPLDNCTRARLKSIDQEAASIRQLWQYCEATQIISHCSSIQQQLLYETIETDLAALAIEQSVLTGVAVEISKSLPPTPQQLATLLYRRFALHQSIAQQDDWLDCHGERISMQTLAEWLAYGCSQLQPIFEALKQLLLQQTVLHVEEIPVSMFRASHRRTQRSHLWMYCTNHLNHFQLCVFDFGYSKAGQHIDDFLRLSNKSMWRGTLVCDGATCYKPVLKQGVQEADVMSSVERKFKFLWESTHSPIAQETLGLLKRLRIIDWDLQHRTPEERVRVRQIQAWPILNFLHALLHFRRGQVPHISVAAQVIDYTISRWSQLTQYIDRENLVFGNNSLEDQVYPVPREDSINWTFTTSIRGGDRGAAMMSLIATAKLNQLDPKTYLTTILNETSYSKKTMIDFSSMLPHYQKSKSISKK